MGREDIRCGPLRSQYIGSHALFSLRFVCCSSLVTSQSGAERLFDTWVKKKKNGIRIRTGLSLVNTTSEKLKLATPRASIRQWDYGAK